MDLELGLTADPERIPQGPLLATEPTPLIGDGQKGCIVLAVADKTSPQAP
jgi:hypothetical protein